MMNLNEWTLQIFEPHIKELLEQMPQGKKLLHLNCGTGELTNLLRDYAQYIVGVDPSEENIGTASAKFPELMFQTADYRRFNWENQFDTVFSYDAFQSVQDQKMMLNSVCRALKPGGYFVCELGAPGNFSEVERGMKSVLGCYGCMHRSPFVYYSATEYREMLSDAGLKVDRLDELELKTALPNGRSSLHDYIKKIFPNEIDTFAPQLQEEMFAHIENVFLANCWKTNFWELTFRHLRVIAHKAAQ